jgi:hypothetical protein
MAVFKNPFLSALRRIRGFRVIELPGVEHYLDQIREQAPAITGADDIIANCLRLAATQRGWVGAKLRATSDGPPEQQAEATTARLSAASVKDLETLRKQSGAPAEDAALILGAIRWVASKGWLPPVKQAQATHRVEELRAFAKRQKDNEGADQDVSVGISMPGNTTSDDDSVSFTIEGPKRPVTDPAERADSVPATDFGGSPGVIERD